MFGYQYAHFRIVYVGYGCEIRSVDVAWKWEYTVSKNYTLFIFAITFLFVNQF